MPFVEKPGITGKIFVPDPTPERRKHNCPDCFSCQMCGDDRCELCKRCDPDPESRCKPERDGGR